MGFMGISVGRLLGGDEALCSATAVLGMVTLFASVMHLPVTGIVLMLELTRAKYIMLHVAISTVISSTFSGRLPHGHHSYVHTVLHHLPVWQKLGGQDFIENDEHEENAEATVGLGRLKMLRRLVFGWRIQMW